MKLGPCKEFGFLSGDKDFRSLRCRFCRRNGFSAPLGGWGGGVAGVFNGIRVSGGKGGWFRPGFRVGLRA